MACIYSLVDISVN